MHIIYIKWVTKGLWVAHLLERYGLKTRADTNTHKSIFVIVNNRLLLLDLNGENNTRNEHKYLKTHIVLYGGANKKETLEPFVCVKPSA